DGDERHWDVMSRARAVDNGVYLVASSTVAKSPSRIIDPDGDVLAETLDRFGIVASSINLERESRLRWLSVGPAEGEARSLYIKERRPRYLWCLDQSFSPLKEAAASGAESVEHHS